MKTIKELEAGCEFVTNRGICGVDGYLCGDCKQKIKQRKNYKPKNKERERILGLIDEFKFVERLRKQKCGNPKTVEFEIKEELKSRIEGNGIN